MNRRLLLGVVTLALLATTAGCLGFGTSSVSDERLDSDPEAQYAWDATVDAHISVETDAQFRAVYRMNESEIELFRRDGFGGRNPISVSAVRYRYPNETVINGSEIKARGGDITRTRDVVRITLPEDAPAAGKVAFTGSSTPKRFSLPTFVQGSYELVLPPDRRVDFFLFGTVRPAPDSRETIDGQTHIYWDDVTAESLTVQFYLQRDLAIFAGAALISVLVGFGGLLYYKRQISALREQREELGLDVDTEDDDFGRDPPPGMQ